MPECGQFMPILQKNVAHNEATAESRDQLARNELTRGISGQRESAARDERQVPRYGRRAEGYRHLL